MYLTNIVFGSIFFKRLKQNMLSNLNSDYLNFSLVMS